MSGARILLVEDDAVIRDLVARNLTMRNHDVHVAGDARSAQAQLRAWRFDLVILDINLPDQTGWDVLRAALHEGRIEPLAIEGDSQKLPVVVLSAVRISSRRLAEFPLLAYLPKPFPMDALLRLAAEAAARRTSDGPAELEGPMDTGNPRNYNGEELHA